VRAILLLWARRRGGIAQSFERDFGQVNRDPKLFGFGRRAGIRRVEQNGLR
jgi:hypothetical protein